MHSPHERRSPLASSPWPWLFSLALSAGGILLGIHIDDFHLVNRSAAVILLVIALSCVRDILG